MVLTVAALPGPVWGISGKYFVLGHAALVLLSRVAAQPIWGWMTSARTRRTRWVDSEPYALAYLNDGPRLAVLAALTCLLVAGRVEIESQPPRIAGTTFARRGPQAGAPATLPVGDHRALGHPLPTAIEAETRLPVDRVALAQRDAVLVALDDVGARLRRHGLLRAESRGWRRATILAVVMTPAILIGIAWVVTALAEHRSVWPVVLSVLVALSLGVGPGVFGQEEPVSDGRSVLAGARTGHSHLLQCGRPTWTGPEHAAFAVALFGSNALLVTRPDLAHRLDLTPVDGFGISSRPEMPRRYRDTNWSGPPPAGSAGPLTPGGPVL